MPTLVDTAATVSHTRIFRVGQKVGYYMPATGWTEGRITAFRVNRFGTHQAVVQVPGPYPTRHVNLDCLLPL